MKKFSSILIIFILSLSLLITPSSAAKIGDIIGYALYTDIIASINGFNIASFNIDGYTAIVAEDLRNYGFDVEWVPSQRALYIERAFSNTITSTYRESAKNKSDVGKRMHNILYTDIKTYVNGKIVSSFNINGQTIIYIDDLNVYGNSSYNNDTRRIDLTINDGLEFNENTSWEFLTDVCSPYQTSVCNIYKTSGTKTFPMAGKDYHRGLTFGGAFYSGETSYALFNFDGKFSKMKFDLGINDWSMVDGLDASKRCTVYFYADGKIIKEISVSFDQLPQNVTLDLNHCSQFEISVSNFKARLSMGDIMIK